jgi:hypothetical protein
MIGSIETTSPQRLKIPLMYEYTGNLHIHTPYSDGHAYHADIAGFAIGAGLDFVVVTDHNLWVDGVEGYYENDHGRVLLLVGEEVHDVRRVPQANHFLALGADKELHPFATSPQRLIDEVSRAGGYGFIAHPYDPAVEEFNEPDLGWCDWGVEGYSGIELWNYMSSFKGCLGGMMKSVRAAYRPEQAIVSPEPATLALWDEMLAKGRRVAVIGGSDAHGATYHVGPISRVLFPYDYLFRAVNTHVLLRQELTGRLEEDKKLILEAVGRGNSWVAYDLPHQTKGFRFSGQGRTRGIMGDEIRLDAGATLQAHAPVRCSMRLLHNGTVVASVDGDSQLTHIPVDPGAYRVECAIRFKKKQRGWIYSNPIYLV